MQCPAILLALVLPGMLVAQAAAPANSLDRLLEVAQKSPDWKNARNQADRLGLLRKQALKYAPVSDLVSDRYLITALAGPVDLVRFFGLARTVCSGSMERRAALLKEWKREGGDQLKVAAAAAANSELGPDDFPSNALGALFGEELKPHNANLSRDLTTDVRNFFDNLSPMADAVTARFSLNRLVLGLEPNATPQARRASNTWLTAEPLYLLPILDPERAKIFASAPIALKAAGLEVRSHGGNPIVIERVGTPEPVVVDTTKYPKAVPVVERYPKAVPVKEKAIPKSIPKAVPVE